MDRKKLIIALVICLVLLATLLLVKNLRNGTGIVAGKLHEVKEKIDYSQSKEHQNEKMIDKVLAKVQTALQNEDYNALYEMTDETYLDYKFFGDRTRFRAYMKNFVGKDVELELQEYQEMPSKYRCTFVLYRKQGGSYVFDGLVMKESGKIIFDTITAISAYHIVATSDKLGLEFTLVYAVTAPKKAICTIEIKNTGEKEVSYAFQNVELINNSDRAYEPDAIPEQMKIPAGMTVRRTIEFTKNGILSEPKKEMRLRLSSEDDSQMSDLVVIPLGNVSI